VPGVSARLCLERPAWRTPGRALTPRSSTLIRCAGRCRMWPPSQPPLPRSRDQRLGRKNTKPTCRRGKHKCDYVPLPTRPLDSLFLTLSARYGEVRRPMAIPVRAPHRDPDSRWRDRRHAPRLVRPGVAHAQDTGCEGRDVHRLTRWLWRQAQRLPPFLRLLLEESIDGSDAAPRSRALPAIPRPIRSRTRHGPDTTGRCVAAACSITADSFMSAPTVAGPV
jgi:hypothetical protein